MSKRRDNRLSAEEINTAIKPLEQDALTFDEAFKLFIADGERRGLRPFTIDYYKQHLGMFRRYLVSIDKVGIISGIIRHDIDNYVEHEKRRGLKNRSINVNLRAVRAFFGFLKQSKFIVNNPMEKYPLLREQIGNIETFSMKQLRRLLKAPDRRTFTGLRDYTFMLLLLETGVRLTESAHIQYDKFVVETERMYVS